jgi:hypothetical protein
MRISIQLVIFLLLLNGAAGAVTASGAGDALGINPSPGGDEQANSTVQNASNVEPGGGLGDTLFSLYTSVTRGLTGVITFVFYGPVMLTNLGIPAWLTGMFSGALSIIVMTDTIYALTGRGDF